MPNVHDLSPSFNAGELSPRLSARVDFTKFPSGLAVVENLIALAEGGITRRGGSRYAATTKTSTVKSRLKKFQFSTSQAYTLEYGEQYMRFFRDQGQLFAANIDASITNGTFDSDISSWTDESSGGGSRAWNAAGVMDLIFSATEGHAEQEITNSTAIDHTIQFQVLGAAGDTVTFQVGTSTGASDIISFSASVGYHMITFPATAANFFVQFKGSSEKTVQIDNVVLLDDVPLELITPYAEADLYDIEGPQSADVLYQFHNIYPPYKLARTADTSWSFIEVAYMDGPYLDQNITATTLTPAAATGKGINVTASSIIGINNDTGFQSTDIGRLIRIDNPASGVDWGSARIVSVTSTTVAVADIDSDMPYSANTADVNWRLGAWSETTGYPATGTFFEQRLYTGNTTNQPQTFWASQTDNFELFRPDSDPTTDDIFDGTVEDDDAINYTLSANDVNAILWMSAGENALSIGTSGGIWVPSSQGAALTPLDIAVKRQVTTQAAKIEPVRVDSILLYTQRAKRKILEFGFTIESDGFKSTDMTRLAQHITFGGVVEMDYAEEPDSIVWAVRKDGQLLGMTFRRNEDVVGWGRHIFGGKFVGGNSVTETDISFDSDGTISTVAGDFSGYTVGEELFVSGTANNDFSDIGIPTVVTVADDGLSMTVSGVTLVAEAAGAPMTIQAYSDPVVESVNVTPGEDAVGQVLSSEDRDEVWVQVKRTINGTTVRHIEFLEKQFETGDTAIDAFYVDCGLTYNGVATTTITELAHLEGEPVRVWADGAIHPDNIVSGGAITLATAAEVVQVGLAYKHKLKTLRFEGGNASGTSVGKRQRVFKVAFVLLDTHTIKFGPSPDKLTPKDFREVTDAMDHPVPFFTGISSLEFDGDWSDDPRVFIESDDPAPFTLLALAPERGNNAMK